MSRTWYPGKFGLIAPVIITSFNDDHIILANPFATYECDGFDKLPKYAGTLTRGSRALLCGIFPWPVFKQSEKVFIKKQARFSMVSPTGTPYKYHSDASIEYAYRIFYECHNARSFPSIDLLTSISNDKYDGILGMVQNLRQNNSVLISQSQKPWLNQGYDIRDSGAVCISDRPEKDTFCQSYDRILNSPYL